MTETVLHDGNVGGAPREMQVRVVNHRRIISGGAHGVKMEVSHTLEQFIDGEWHPLTVIERETS
jgi:hypothetical protein